MQRGAAVLAAVLVVAMNAGAGTPEDPEITDPAGDTQFPNATWVDILAAWLNETATDLVVSMMVGDTGTTFPGSAWFVVFDASGVTYGVACQSDPGGAVACGYGHWDRAQGPTDFTSGTGALSGSTVTMNMPLAFVENATAGTVLTTIEAGTGQLTPVALVPAPLPVPLPGEAFFQGQDTAAASRDYVLGGPVAPLPSNNTGNNTNQTEPPAPAPRTPGFEAPAVIVAAGLLALAVRRRA